MRNSKVKALLVTLALVLCVCLLLSAFCEAYFQYPAYYYEDAKVRKDLAGSLDTLIIGSSHAFRAFDPTVLDETLGTHSYNLSGALLTMEGRYLLLEKELERNPVRTVVIELSYNALLRDRDYEGPEGDIYLLGRLDSLPERIGAFFKLIRPSEYAEVFHDTLTRSRTAWGMLLKGQIGAPQMEEKRGFIPLQSTDLTLPYYDTFESYFDEFIYPDFRPDREKLLRDCVALCREKGARVIFAVTPLSDGPLIRYYDLGQIYEYYVALAEELDVPLYDFNLIRTREDYPPATAFFDELHLSGSGAETFSRSFADVLARADAGEDISPLFFETYEQAALNALALLRASQNQ